MTARKNLRKAVTKMDAVSLQRFYKLEERLYGLLAESEKSWRSTLDARTAGAGESDKLPI